MGVGVYQEGHSCAARPKDLTDLDTLCAIFAGPFLTTCCRLGELGPEAVGQRLESAQAVVGRRHQAAFTDERPALPRGLLAGP